MSLDSGKHSIATQLGVCCCITLVGTFAHAAGDASDAADPVAQPAYLAPLASHALLLDVARVGNTIVAVGERGIALHSADDGASWAQGEVPVRSTLTGVHMHDEQLGWAVGHDAVILRTNDSGRSWQLLNYAPQEETPLLDVWFADASHGYAIGAYGKFLATSDGGDSWDERDFIAPPLLAATGQPAAVRADAAQEDSDSDRGEIWEEDAEGPLDYHLNQIVAAPGGRLYIAGEAGHVFRSDDGGATWSTLPSPYDGSFFCVLPLGADSLLVLGLRGHMFRSDDGGGSWTELDSGTTATLNQGVRGNDGTVVVAGLAGTVLDSKDDGHSFSLHERADRLGTSGLLFTAVGQLLFAGEGGVRRMTLTEALASASP